MPSMQAPAGILPGKAGELLNPCCRRGNAEIGEMFRQAGGVPRVYRVVYENVSTE